MTESLFLFYRLFVVVDMMKTISSTTQVITQEVEMSKERLNLDSPFKMICMSSDLNFYELKCPS